MRNQRFICSSVLALILLVTLGLACVKRDWSICSPKDQCQPGFTCTDDFRCVRASDGGSDSLLAVDSQGATDVVGGSVDAALSAGSDGPGGAGPDTAVPPVSVPPDAAVSTVPDAPAAGGPPDVPATGGSPDAPTTGGPPDVPATGGPPDVPAAGGSPDAAALEAPPSGSTVDALGTCSADKDCPVGSPLCLGNRCAKCAGNNDCTGRTGTPVCAASGLCVACATGTQQCNGLQPQTCNASGAWQNNGNACPYVCNTATGACSGACALGTKQCSGAQPQTCDANGAWQNTGSACSGCTTCSPAVGACAPATGTPCDDGNPCTTGETCQAGVCTGGTTMTCPTPAKCRGAGTCDPSTGICTNPTLPNNTACDDGNSCTQYDSCQGGTCVGTALTCVATTCHVAGTCSAGTCSQGAPVADGTTDPTCPGSAPRCYSGSCVQCLSDQHCSGSTPSCDPATHQCVCRRKSATNYVLDPGFDSATLASWDQYNMAGDVVWSDEDSEGCLGSGSARGDNTEGDPSQCFPIPGGGTYYFGVKFKMPLYVGSDYCDLAFTTGTDCYGGVGTWSASVRIGPTSGTWTGPGWASFSAPLVAPQGSQRGFVSCSMLQTKLDQVYVNSINNSF